MGGSTPPPSPPPSPPDNPKCPETIKAILTGPAEGIAPNSWHEVIVDRSDGHPRVLVRDPVLEEPIGSLAGVKNLSVLINCIEQGVEYQAYVTAVDGGQVSVTITKQT